MAPISKVIEERQARDEAVINKVLESTKGLERKGVSVKPVKAMEVKSRVWMM